MSKQHGVICSSECFSCPFFPDISVDKYPYYFDENGIKHRDIKYICQYDNHEINFKTKHCKRIGVFDGTKPTQK